MLMFALLVSFALGEDAKPTPAKLNRLAGETSPYLLQHAANPVDWQPWSPVALQQARRENKLIFLSIGYSSCHWCHVMERLAFSDQTIAAYLNQNFVCIKVDREERPDLDEVYMLALQGYLKLSGQGGSGGWPLSLFLTPDAQPVAGGSYFPPTDEGGRPGFLTILKQMQTAWSTREKDVRDSAAVLSQFTAKLTQPDANAQKVVAGPALVAAATLAVSAGHDPEFGGFEFDAATPNAPKFPTPSRLQLLQGQIGQDTVNSARFSEQLERTLDHMARGGMHDHLAGGFHRYTVDRRWLQPHFEKMLPDNAQLLEVYLDAARRTGLSTHRAVAERIANFVLQELCDGAGGFHSSLDSDADGVEGQHYTWTKAQLTAVLPATDYTTFAVAYGLDDAQAFTLPAVLHLPRPLHESARVLKVPQSELEARLSEMQGQLLQARRARSPVRKDDKVLTGWNGLMIQALARAGAAWHRTEWVKAAEKAALFLLATHRDSNGDLLRSSRQGAAHIPAYLDDYAYLTGGLLALHEATGEDKWLSAARRLMDTQIRLFWDEQRGGFFFTSSQHESLLVRTRDAYDDALPSPNGVSLRNLVKLARWTHDDRFKELAHRTADAFAPQLQATPANLSTLALGLQENLHWFGQSGPRKLDGNLFADQSAPLVDQLAQGPGPAPAAGDAALVPALKATAEEAAAHKQVSAVIYLDVDKLTPGRKARVAVEMKVARGWHVNANPPSPEFMIPTKLAVKSLGKLELKEIKYPAGKPFRVSGIDEALSVYEGTVYLTATLEVPANWQGNEDLTAELDYQACNDQSCLRPAKLTLTGKLNSSPSPQVVNKALFDKLFPVGRN